MGPAREYRDLYSQEIGWYLWEDSRSFQQLLQLGAGVLPSSAPLASAWWPSFSTVLYGAQLVFMCHQPRHMKQTKRLQASFCTWGALVTAQGAWGKSAESQSQALW